MHYLMFSGFESLVYELSTWCFKSSSGLCGESVERCLCVCGASVWLCGFVVDWLVFAGVDWCVF